MSSYKFFIVVAAYAAKLQRRPFHGLSPKAICYRRSNIRTNSKNVYLLPLPPEVFIAFSARAGEEFGFTKVSTLPLHVGSIHFTLNMVTCFHGK